jgi:glycosyltransferase involved in cell wall biosynthesis
MREALEIAPFIQDKSLTIGTLIREREPLSESEKNEAKKTWKIPLDAFVIGNAGWLISRKRWDVFLNVAADVAARVPHARFLIAGDGPERHLLQAQASELGISSRIDWIGWQKNLDSFYKSLDVLLFNSDWDAQPRTPLEAMSYGVPVVASILNGGTQEIIRNDQDGFLMKTHDLGSMADILVRLAEDASYRRILGDQGRLRILEYASPQKYAEVTLRALRLA